MIKEGIENRLTDSIETVMKLTGGLLLVDVVGGEPMNFKPEFFPARIVVSALMRLSHEAFLSIIRLELFPVCHGLGFKMEFDVDLMIAR